MLHSDERTQLTYCSMMFVRSDGNTFCFSFSIFYMMFSSCNPKFYPVNPSIAHFHTDAVVPSSDHCRTETVLPPSDHYCIEAVATSGDHYCIDIVVPSSDHCCTEIYSLILDASRVACRKLVCRYIRMLLDTMYIIIISYIIRLQLQ